MGVDVLEGKSEDVIQTPFARTIFAPLLAIESVEGVAAFTPSAMTDSARAFLASAHDATLAQAALLFLATACLNSFVASNYTGPPLDSALADGLLAGLSAEVRDAIFGRVNTWLKMDGEDVYDFSHSPLTLVLARSILFPLGLTDLSLCRSAAWWSLRYGRVHQDLLEQNSATLKAFIDQATPIAMAAYGIPPTVEAPAGEDAAEIPPAQTPYDHVLATHLYLELAHISHFYWAYKQIDDSLDNAKKALGVDIGLTGVMGKRTRWQKHEKAQLVVEVKQSESRIAELARLTAEGATAIDPVLMEHLPHNLSLDSDVLLDRVALSSSPDAPVVGGEVLGFEEQALLLALHEHIRRTKAGHITKDEEMLGYVVRVLQESSKKELDEEGINNSFRSWALECSALYHRSVLECSDNHSRDRALQQLEELSALFDRMHAPTTVASVASLAGSKSIEDYSRSDILRVRMKQVWLSNYPSIWSLKQGIASTFQTIGLIKSALDLFLSISAFDGVIESSMLLGKLTQAEAIIHERLREKPDEPKLLCLLADCTRDITHYERAWEVSNHTYPRAQRSLANYKMNRGLHAEAIPHFQLALDINPVFPSEWYAMGWCAMQIHDYSIAAQAFSRTVSFDPEYANAWNNLAAAHLNLKNKPAGFNALEQAIKFKSDSWKLWENYMITAIDLREFGKAISAMEKIVTLKAGLNTQGEKEARLEAEEKSGAAGKIVVDEQVLTILNRVVVDVAKEDGPDAFIVNRFMQMLNTTLQHVVNHPLVYSCLADIYELKSDIDKSILMREKQVRFVQDATARWSEKLTAIQDVVAAHEQLTDIYIRSNTRSNLMAAKFSLDTLLNKLSKLPLVTDSAEGKQCIAQIQGLQQRVATATANAPSAATAAAASASGSGASSSMSIWR